MTTISVQTLLSSNLPVGATGISGFSGQQGISGFSGTNGTIGTDGATGATGVSGFSGQTGEQGISGFSGFSGETGIEISDTEPTSTEILWVDTSEVGESGNMVYPAAGVAVSTGTAWDTSKTTPTGDIVGTTDTQTLTNKTAEKLILNDGFTEEVFAITDGASVNLDPNNGSIQTWTLGASRTPDQANWAAGQSINLLIDDGTDYAITWSTLAVEWKSDAGVAPTLNTTGFTVIVLWKVGTTIYGARVGDA